MKRRLLVELLIVIFIFSAFSVALAAAGQCPRCKGTGIITQNQPCPTCQGSAATKPNIVLERVDRGATALHGLVSANVRGLYHNKESFGVDAVFTGQIRTQTGTYTNTSSKTHFNANEEVWVVVPITFEGTSVAPDWAYTISFLQVENVDCPSCGGTGYKLVTTSCPDCGGTGVLSASFGDFSNIQGVGGAVVGVVVVGAVVVAGFFFVKKKRVTEESLRRLSNFEFQDWVAKRLGSSSQESGSYLGIDGFTSEGYPFQARQEDDVGKRAIDSFATAVGRSKARTGTIVAFSFGRDALEGVTRARLNYRLEIKTLTVRELMLSEKRTLLNS